MKRHGMAFIAVLATAVPVAAQTAQTPPAPTAPAPAAPRRGAAPTAKPATPPRPASAGMTNQDVIRMVAAGLPDDVIITAIRQAPRRSFTLSADSLVALKQAKVSDAVIRVMQAGDAASADPTPAAAVAAPAPAPPPPPPPVEVVLPKGATVQVQLKTPLSSKTAKIGDRLEFEVVEDVVVSGKTLMIKKGSIASGQVTDALAQRRRNAAKLEFNIASVKAANGADVRLSGKQGAEGRRGGTDISFASESPFTAITEEDFSIKVPQP